MFADAMRQVASRPFSSSKRQARGSVRGFWSPARATHVAAPRHAARARAPSTAMSQPSKVTRCDRNSAKARPSARASTDGHTARAAAASSRE